MSIENLKLSFYSDNSKDIYFFLENYRNCWEKNIYLVMKNKTSIPFDPYNIFLEEPTFRVRIVPEEGCVYFCDVLFSNDFLYRFCDCTVYEKYKDKDTIVLVEDLLSKGEIIIGTTVDTIFPFTVFYNPDTTAEEEAKTW